MARPKAVEAHDRFWLKRLPDGTVEAAGRVQSCIDCRGSHAAEHDFPTTARSRPEG